MVIELCEPVLIRRIDMANLELFSSTFENFTVYISRAANGGKERQGKTIMKGEKLAHLILCERSTTRPTAH